MHEISFSSFISEHDVPAFPYFYSEEYSGFTSKHEGKKLFITGDKKGNTMVCRKWKNKFLIIIQPLYPPLNHRGERIDAAEEKTFLNAFITHVDTGKLAHRITQPENSAIFKTVPNGAVSAPFGTYFLDLANNTEEKLFKELHSKHRNVIRNAEKSNVTIKYGKEVINDFFVLYEQTMKRSDKYCQPLSYFENFQDIMPQNIVCGVAYYNNKPQGGLFIPYSNFGAFYLYGASAETKEINGAVNYLHWETIKSLKSKGVRRYDFVGARLSDVSGSRLDGIQQFKERFGSELEKGFLWKLDINKTYCNLFDSMVRFKLKLKGLNPPVDIIDEERTKISA
ncbi:MAG: lipid II:glycine glycyltransferase FemX [Bacteroidia bacterium]